MGYLLPSIGLVRVYIQCAVIWAKIPLVLLPQDLVPAKREEDPTPPTDGTNANGAPASTLTQIRTSTTKETATQPEFKDPEKGV